MKFGQTVIPRNNFYQWTDKQISFFIPDQAGSGPILIFNGFDQVKFDYKFTVYNLSGDKQVYEVNNSLYFKNSLLDVKKAIIEINGQLIEKEFDNNIAQPFKIISQTSISDLTWLTLYNKENKILSYYINPLNLN